MASTQNLVVVLLVVAIVFSLASVVLTLSLNSLTPVKPNVVIQSPGIGTPVGGVGLTVEPQVLGGAP